ncbi:Bgt-50369 [Blumeria graminis f. sp. tritici]|uniref:Bgt-50369 n=1 Tax=Blumeria graminis f. sp. tritici TaxID=62690 RepID=A0A9X9PRF9_BLUGR|nr:Bgt-50369 [Blumeria graminis f. sp. tritici]
MSQVSDLLAYHSENSIEDILQSFRCTFRKRSYKRGKNSIATYE